MWCLCSGLLGACSVVPSAAIALWQLDLESFSIRNSRNWPMNAQCDPEVIASASSHQNSGKSHPKHPKTKLYSRRCWKHVRSVLSTWHPRFLQKGLLPQDIMEHHGIWAPVPVHAPHISPNIAFSPHFRQLGRNKRSSGPRARLELGLAWQQQKHTPKANIALWRMVVGKQLSSWEAYFQGLCQLLGGYVKTTRPKSKNMFVLEKRCTARLEDNLDYNVASCCISFYKFARILGFPHPWESEFLKGIQSIWDERLNNPAENFQGWCHGVGVEGTPNRWLTWKIHLGTSRSQEFTSRLDLSGNVIEIWGLNLKLRMPKKQLMTRHDPTLSLDTVKFLTAWKIACSSVLPYPHTAVC